ncbi:Nitronate monooxygenase [Zhongshania aliphaticivorans]|uniref:Nitronate monooxygenase n=1 Tax=Zhongshania aliphaticivorans TaxID=1470434 RepID=A0A5S9N6V1_9GAMM|nr:nitronate monooxygenase family protein [Zhongshania aliphaticivorans]CAA0082021.1 Nitronate monooxygenase [Zhongshania aliphaticivorans]CAA0084618.1 Nitronate monooxygenase [Zhongshania aliphaticivorans]
MALPELLENKLQLPAVAAPMFLASGPELVIETCKAGMVGTFPALNQRTSDGFEDWLNTINSALSEFEASTGKKAAPFAVNLIVHKTNPRLEADLALCVKHKVPIIITSLGAVKSVIDAVHGYGGVVFHDVINARHARKAADAGVDGLIAVCAGAGGHAGTTNPFALVAEIRAFFDKTLLLAGAISKGSDIAAAQVMGADLAYMGTRFINTQESLVQEDYKSMIASSQSSDIIYTPNISGVYANFLKPSIEQAGLDPNNLAPKTDIDFGQELEVDADNKAGEKAGGAWKQIWSAGQGVGAIDNIPTTAELVSTLIEEYHAALAKHK